MSDASPDSRIREFDIALHTLADTPTCLTPGVHLTPCQAPRSHFCPKPLFLFARFLLGICR
jgi:hypothetical protein